MKNLFRTCVVSFIIILFTSISFGQALNRQMKMIKLEETTKINPEPEKAYLLVRSEVPNLMFDSNRNIEKVNRISSGDWELWLPAGTHILKIDAPGFQRLELQPFNFARKRSYELVLMAVAALPGIRADENLFDVTFQLNQDEVYVRQGSFAPMPAKGRTIPYKLAKGEYAFRFQKQGFADEALSVTVDGPKEVTVTMRPGTTTGAGRLTLPGIITVSSEPTGAEILINSQRVGVTPYQMEIPAGDHQLELRKPLYHPDISTFTLEQGKTQSLQRNLKPRFGYLSVQTVPSNASVHLDNKPIGQAPVVKREIESSRHALRVELPLYHPHSEEFEIKDGEERPFTVTLRPAFGTLEVRSLPEEGADIFLDGAKVGITPFVRPQIASGRYILKVSRTLYGDLEEEILISDGQATRKTVTLSKNFGELMIEAPQAAIFLNDAPVGNDRHTARLAPGRYKARADRGPLYRPAEQEVFLGVGENRTIRLEPAPRVGSLSIIVEPFEARDAEIYVGTELRGKAPLVLELMMGDHAILAKKENFLETAERVALRENEQRKLALTMLTYQGSLQAARDRWGQAKWISFVASALAGGAAAYFYTKSEASYKDYQAATSSAEAVRLRELTRKNDLYLKVSLSVAGTGMVSTLFTWAMQAGQ